MCVCVHVVSAHHATPIVIRVLPKPESQITEGLRCGLNWHGLVVGKSMLLQAARSVRGGIHLWGSFQGE